jgi:hypothetical protein
MITDERKIELLMKRTQGHIQHIEELLTECKKNTAKIRKLRGEPEIIQPTNAEAAKLIDDMITNRV